MTFLDQDVQRLVSTSPYMALLLPKTALGALGAHVQLAEEHADTLRAFPQERLEELDVCYLCLAGLGTLSPPLLDDLMLHSSFRGAVWGSWLALLEPRAEYADALRRGAAEHPKNAWIIELALAEVQGRQAPEHAALLDIVARFRALLTGLPRPKIPMRLAPDQAQRALMLEETAAIRAAYQSGGADGARALIAGTLCGYYAMDWERWVEAGAPPPPAGGVPTPASGQA